MSRATDRFTVSVREKEGPAMVRGPVLSGEMVRLRPFAERDDARLWEALKDDDAIRLAGRPMQFSRGESDAWATESDGRPDHYDWAIDSMADHGVDGSDRLIGRISLYSLDEASRSGELRLTLLAEYRGRGYGRDAISQVLAFAFGGGDSAVPNPLGLHRIGIELLVINPRARMLYESLGFTVEGRLREVYRDGDDWVDAIVLSLLEDEYRAQG